MRMLVGAVLDMNNEWLKIEGSVYTLVKGELIPRVDKKSETLDTSPEINIMRMLPSNLNLKNLKYKIEE